MERYYKRSLDMLRQNDSMAERHEPWFMENRPIVDRDQRVFVEFFRAEAATLGVEPDGTRAWACHAEDGTPWTMLTVDFTVNGVGEVCLRLDVDADGVRGGLSPFAVKGDEGVPASAAGVDPRPPRGIRLPGPLSSEHLRMEAFDWLHHAVRRQRSASIGQPAGFGPTRLEQITAASDGTYQIVVRVGIEALRMTCVVTTHQGLSVVDFRPDYVTLGPLGGTRPIAAAVIALHKQRHP